MYNVIIPFDYKAQVLNLYNIQSVYYYLLRYHDLNGLTLIKHIMSALCVT